ncbi:unnamed protein product [Closterium sp. Naga37s-1]|nr:unnamed protein product [Closterium sp. Naga37s-1]
MRSFHLFQIIVEPTARLQVRVGFPGLCGVGPPIASHHSRIQRHLHFLSPQLDRRSRGPPPLALSVTLVYVCPHSPSSPSAPFLSPGQAYVRGTCTSSLRNWIADLEALPRSLSYPGLRHARVHRGFYSAYHFTRLRPAVVHAVLFLMTILPGSFRVAFTGHSLGGALATLSALDLQVCGLRHARVHRGFYSAYHFTRLRPAVVHAVLFLMTILPGSFSVALTGQSLGAALATLSALDLQVGGVKGGEVSLCFSVSYDLPSPVIQVVTFGSPRVGNAAFAAYFRQKVPKSTRVTNWKDLVPHLPPATIGYHHVATEAWIIPDSVHNVSFSPSSSALPTQKGRSGSVSLPTQKGRSGSVSLPTQKGRSGSVSLPTQKGRSGSVSLPHLLRQRRSLPRRVLHRRSLQRGPLQQQLLQEQTLLIDERDSHTSHQGNLTWHVHQCDETGEDPCCSRSVVGDSIANHLEYLGVPLHSGHSSSDS